MVALVAGDLQALDGISLAVKDALIRIAGILADGGPRLVAQVDVLGEDGVVSCAAACIDLLRKPGQLPTAADLVHVAHLGRRNDVVRAAPGGLFRQRDGHGPGTVLGDAGQVDAAGLLGVIGAFERPVVPVAHRQGIRAVLVGGHRPLPGDDGQLALVRIGEGHRHGRLGLHGHGVRLVRPVNGHAALGGLIAEQLGGVGVGAVYDGIGIFALRRQLGRASLDRQLRVLGLDVKGQLVPVLHQLHPFGDVLALDGHGAALGGVVTGFVGNGVVILAHADVCKRVFAVRADRLHLFVPRQDRADRAELKRHRVLGVGVDILPAQDGIAVVEVDGVRLEGIAQGEGQVFELVGGFTGDACIRPVAATRIGAVVVIAVGKGVAGICVTIRKTARVA